MKKVTCRKSEGVEGDEGEERVIVSVVQLRYRKVVELMSGTIASMPGREGGCNHVEIVQTTKQKVVFLRMGTFISSL